MLITPHFTLVSPSVSKAGGTYIQGLKSIHHEIHNRHCRVRAIIPGEGFVTRPFFPTTNLCQVLDKYRCPFLT